MKPTFIFVNITIDARINSLFHNAQFELWVCGRDLQYPLYTLTRIRIRRGYVNYLEFDSLTPLSQQIMQVSHSNNSKCVYQDIFHITTIQTAHYETMS
jgi:hypothetical protein